MKMKMDELYQLTQKGLPAGHLVLDVRDDDEFAEGHVEGALNIPADQVAAHVEKLKKYTRIYIHCGGGGRAGKAFTALEQAGLKNIVHICESGMRMWKEKGWPLKT